jgi:hypothetical protein
MSRKHLETIGRERLRKIVDQTNLTVTALAQRCKITRSGFNVWLLNGKLPTEQLEKILVIAAFNEAEIDDKPEPILLGDKSFIPDFIVTPKDSSHSLKVEVKLSGINTAQEESLRKVGVDVVVFLEGDVVRKIPLDTVSITNASVIEPSRKLEVTKAPDSAFSARHSFLLRPSSGQMVNIEVPVDLTVHEATRLALYIQSLVSDTKSHIQKNKNTSKRLKRVKK